MIAGLLWYLRLPKVHVSLKVQSKAVTFKLKKPWRPHKSYAVDKVRIERLNGIFAPALDLEIETESDEAWLEIDGKNVVLQKLEFEQNGFLELNPKRGRIEIFYRGSGLKGEVAVSGLSVVSAGENLNKAGYNQINEDFKIPESIRFIAKSSGMVPTLIRLHPQEDWTFQDIYVQELSFFSERISEPGSIFFESTINSGSINLHDVSMKETLQEGDRLIIGGLDGRLIKISHGSDINLIYEGTVEQLLIGPKRVVPLCLLASEHPEVVDELSRQAGSPEREDVAAQFVMLWGRPINWLSNEDAALFVTWKRGRGHWPC